MTGMAPSPEQLARQKMIQEGNGEQLKPSGDEISVDSPLFRSEISQIIHGVSWTHQKRVLDHIEILCHNERQWEIVRKIVMGIQTEQTELLRRIIGQRVRELQLKAREATDD